MRIRLDGDVAIPNSVMPKQKALQINKNKLIYGTFSEIGAGQETVRHFFRAGSSSGTIAKAMSAYDRSFSDAIYGAEDDGRYVTESRLRKMLSHEISIMEDRLVGSDYDDKMFFSYANTVATINAESKFKGHGWVGVKFQLNPVESYSQVILHLRFKQDDPRMQQETLGVLGVNLIYASFYLNTDSRYFINSLYDNISKRDLEIDMISFSGSRFNHVDNRIASLHLLRQEMTSAVMFDKNGNNVLPAQVLFQKDLLMLRGRFRPITKLNVDMYEKSIVGFTKEKYVEESNIYPIFEISLSHLLSSSNVPMSDRDFLHRANLLNSLGHDVMITNFKAHYRLVDYLGGLKGENIALTIGAENLVEIFNPKHYTHLRGGILEALSKLFVQNVRLYVYPYYDREKDILIDCESVKKLIHEDTKRLYGFLKIEKRVKEITDYDSTVLKISSSDIINRINKGQEGWASQLPKGVAKIIKDNKLFGYRS